MFRLYIQYVIDKDIKETLQDNYDSLQKEKDDLEKQLSFSIVKKDLDNEMKILNKYAYYQDKESKLEDLVIDIMEREEVKNEDKI